MLTLAIRNLLRNRRRSVATLLALSIGAASILLFGGYIANIRYTLQSAYVRAGGHLQIQHRDFYLYGSGNPSAYAIQDYQKILDAIRTDSALKGMVRITTPTLQFVGVGGNYDAGVSRTIMGLGAVAADVRQMRDWNQFNVRLGRELPPFRLDGAPENAALIGVGLGRVLLLCSELSIPNCKPPASMAKTPSDAKLPDDIANLALDESPKAASGKPKAQGRAKIDVLVSQVRGSPNVASLEVLAAEGQGFKELDDVLVLLQFEQAQRLVFGRSGNKATSILVQLHDGRQIGAARKRINELLGEKFPNHNLSVSDFEETNPFYVQSVRLFDTIFSFIFALIGGIVIFTVGNTMTAAVVERTVEIGTLRAVGLRQSGIKRLFMLEGLLLGSCGAVLGCATALLISVVVNRSELVWFPPGSSDPLPLDIRIWGENAMILGTLFGLIVIATVSAWLPARRAAKLNIVEALRHA